MKYYISKTVNGEFEAVIAQVTDALKGIGFGVITTIDVKKTLKEKIDLDFKPYTILGACNPMFVSKALPMEDKLGVILPCNVVVIDQGNGKIEVAAMEPKEMVQAMGNEPLNDLVDEISSLMSQMIASL